MPAVKRTVQREKVQNYKNFGLWEAAEAGDLAQVKSLVASGADPLARFYNFGYDKFRDSLSVAATNGCVECVEFFLGSGCIPAESQSKSKSEAICNVCFDCKDDPVALACVRMLLDKESALAIGHNGFTPLSAAASVGAKHLLQEILLWGDPLALDKLGDDALMIAALHGRMSCVDMLMRVSNLDAKNAEGKGAADIADVNGHPEVAEMIRAYALSRRESVELRDQMQDVPAVRVHSRSI